MAPSSRRAIAVIRECVATDNYAISIHFRKRADERALFWSDLLAVLDDPKDVRSIGIDRFDRPKWAIAGECSPTGDVEIICAIETDESGTEFITIYWKD